MLILASSSPRRKILIQKLFKDFIVISPDVDEDNVKCEIDNLPATLSKLKAESIFKDHPDDIVLACDTIVVFNNEVLGKPKSKLDAKNMLRKLSGNIHKVMSGYTILSKDFLLTRTVTTYVHMNTLSDELINEYVEKGYSDGKAGSYGIQDKEYNLVNKIEGSYDNVVGLPTEDIYQYYSSKINL